MSKFNWWRRTKKKSKLQRKDAFKGRSFLLQQIENGDYDYSDYRRQALQELDYCKKEQAQITNTWKASAQSLQVKLDEVERKYIKRYNKLMEDFQKEEQNLLVALKADLTKEFKIDCWSEAIEEADDQDLVQFYHTYKKVVQEKVAKSLNIA